MGFFDKVKNMFTEEIDDEVKVEKIKNDVTRVAIKSPGNEENEATDPITREILEKFKEGPKEETVKPVEEPIFKEEPEEIQSIFFDDDDFNDLDYKEEEKEEVKEEFYEKPTIYRERVQEEIKEEEPKFKPTPIISPVYGVLDKNYHKEDIISRDEAIAYQKEEDPVDSIRNKAYGTLEDELENTMFGQNSILFKSKEPEIPIEDADSLLDGFADDIGKELDELMNKKTRISNYDEEEEKGFLDLMEEKEEKPDFLNLEEEKEEPVLDEIVEEPILENDIIEEPELDIEEEEKEPVDDLIDEMDEKEPKEDDTVIDDDDLLGFIDSTLYSEGEDE